MEHSPKRYNDILLLGLGGVGYYLAKRLAQEGHAVTIIERDPDLIRKADSEIDARLIQGDAMSFASWREADADKLDYLIAVTNNDAVNILSTLIADRCGVRRKIARVRSLELWQRQAILNANDLKIDLVIRPEETAAMEVARLLKMRAGNVIIDVGRGHMEVMALRLAEGSVLARTRIRDISRQHDVDYFRIVAIARGVNTIIPRGDDELLPGDHAFILVRNQDLPRLMKLTGVVHERRHSVLIIGGGLIGQRIAQLLEGSVPVHLVEEDERRAEELSHMLKRAEVLHGDGSDADTLDHAGLLEMDTVITCTGDNETNIMTSVMARHLAQRRTGAGKEIKTITLVKREEYLPLASAMGSDIVLNKKVLAANEILQYIRRGQMLSVAHLYGVDAEVVELVAQVGAPITRGPLYKLGDKLGDVIIGGLHHEGEWRIAVGATHIQAGDRVVGICSAKNLRDMERLLLG